MNDAIMMQFIQALHKLSEQVLDEIVRHALIQVNETVQLPILNERHHTVADGVLPLEDPALLGATREAQVFELASDLLKRILLVRI